MSNKKAIEKGDKVDICLDAENTIHSATVIKVPNVGTEPWIVRVGKGKKKSTVTEGRLTYIRNYRTITLVEDDK